MNNNDLLYFAGYGLKCYQCQSDKSWDDCTKKEVDCPAVTDITCVKAFGEGKVAGASSKGFIKGCFLKSLCNNDFCKKQLPGVTFSKCDINCCDSDLCNGAKVPMMSTLLLFACVIVAFRRWVVHWKWKTVNVTSKFNTNVIRYFSKEVMAC